MRDFLAADEEAMPLGISGIREIVTVEEDGIQERGKDISTDVLVTGVETNGLADQLGVKRGDIIIGLGDQRIEDPRILRQITLNSKRTLDCC